MVDLAAMAAPGVPGGAGTAISMSRAATRQAKQLKRALTRAEKAMVDRSAAVLRQYSKKKGDWDFYICEDLQKYERQLRQALDDLLKLLKKQRKAARSKAVDRAWKREASRIRKTGKGSRPWNKRQREEILAYERTGKAPKDRWGRAIEGHHKKQVTLAPSLATRGDNIEFRSFWEHRSRGSTRSPKTHPSSGPVGPNVRIDSGPRVVKKVKKTGRYGWTRDVWVGGN